MRKRAEQTENDVILTCCMTQPIRIVAWVIIHQKSLLRALVRGKWVSSKPNCNGVVVEKGKKVGT